VQESLLYIPTHDICGWLQDRSRYWLKPSLVTVFHCSNTTGPSCGHHPRIVSSAGWN